MIKITGIERQVHEWCNDLGEGEYVHHTDLSYINKDYETIEQAYKALEDYGITGLEPWEDWEGHYTTAIIEDENNNADEDGAYLVDYTIKIEQATYIPYTGKWQN